MSIFQPTNIIPSSFTQGTVDVNDTMEISWQVNGNSAMTAFQIDFYLNDTESTFVYSTGKLPKVGETQAQYNLPFYGTDRFGRPQFFTYNAGKTWAQPSMLEATPLTNGNNYKFKITQFFSTVDDIYYVSKTSIKQGKNWAMYLSINSSTPNQYVVFDFPEAYNSATIYYNYPKQKGWIIFENRIIPIPTKLEYTETTGGDKPQLLPLTERYDFLTQTDNSVFITRDTPELTIYDSNEQYADKNTFPDTNKEFAASIGYFVADYKQAQDDPIRWIRWQVETATYNIQTNKWVDGDILSDTGDIDTPTLNYEFNGFFNKQSYAIRAICESDNGLQYDTGWIYFTINIKNQNDYVGTFTAQCLPQEDATLLEWEGVTTIPPTVSPEEYSPSISNGTVTLNANSSVTWDNMGVNSQGKAILMDFDAPWTAVWNGECLPTKTDIVASLIGNVQINGSNFTAPISGMMFSPNGNLLIIYNDRHVYIFEVTNDNIYYKDELLPNGTSFSRVESVNFSPLGNVLLVSDGNYGVHIFNITNNTIADSNTDLMYNGTNLRCESLVFNSMGERLIVSSSSNGILMYSVSGNVFSNPQLIYNINSSTEMSLPKLKISKNDKLLIVYGANPSSSARNTAIYFSVDGDVYTYIGTVNSSSGTALSKTINDVSFSPDGKLLAICGQFDESFILYDVNDSKIDFNQIITKNGAQFMPHYNTYCEFSPNGNALIFSGDTLTNKSVIYNVSGNNISYYSDLTDFCCNIEFSPNSEILLTLASNRLSIQQFAMNYIKSTGISGKIFELMSGDASIVSVSGNDSGVSLVVGNNIQTLAVPDSTRKAMFMFTPTAINAIFYNSSGIVDQSSSLITYTQQPITSISIYGGNSGAAIDSVSVYNTPDMEAVNKVMVEYQASPNFEPVWNSEQYKLYMTANFNGNLEGGTGTASGKGFRVYRQEVGKNVLTPIATVPSTTTSLKDYGTRSQKAYKYSLHAYDSNGAFMTAVEADNTIATYFKNYSLLVCDYDEPNDEYHVRKQYLFALNLNAGSVSNNNSPTLNKNFTPFPTRMPDTSNYKSGTLSGLIGAIYTVPALIEQIGNYKWTSKPSTLDYFDSVNLEKELYDLSVAPYQLFLRDMKGRLRMIATSGAISMTTNIKQKQQSISISLPWVEIGDASDVTIIQTPDDYGWNNDNQILDVQLDVDLATGELAAIYPFPYSGTKFYLTGVNKEYLTAKTPNGVTPAQFNLSDVAEETDDGEVTATVTINLEKK